MDRDVVVVINGRKYVFASQPAVSYRDVADIAGYKSPRKPTVVVSRKDGTGKSMLPGESILPVDGMVFNVADTSAA